MPEGWYNIKDLKSWVSALKKDPESWGAALIRVLMFAVRKKIDDNLGLFTDIILYLWQCRVRQIDIGALEIIDAVILFVETLLRDVNCLKLLWQL
jgi:hypothetical protein